MPRRPLHIGIDRHRVLQAHQARKPQRIASFSAAMGRGNRRKLGIGSGQEQDIARRLAEVDRLVPVADRPLLSEKQMHSLPSDERFDRLAHRVLIHLVQTDDDETRIAGLTRRPGTVEILVDARTHGL